MTGEKREHREAPRLDKTRLTDVAARAGISATPADEHLLVR